MSGISEISNGKAEAFEVGLESPPKEQQTVNIRVDRSLPTASVRSTPFTKICTDN